MEAARILAKIAVELARAVKQREERGGAGAIEPRVLASGDGWSVADVVCTCGPRDRPFEERHTRYAIAIVLAGSFEYRSPFGRAVMTPGSLMLGNHDQPYECRHEHGDGDRCVGFRFDPEWLDGGSFRTGRLPAISALSPLIARAATGALGANIDWETLAIELAGAALDLASKESIDWTGGTRGVARAIRAIDRDPDASLTIEALARQAGLSPFHFLRTFQLQTGVTPHQYILRARLREAAVLLRSESKVLDVAYDCGFGDVSNFNRTFRREFGMSPREWRRSYSAFSSARAAVPEAVH